MTAREILRAEYGDSRNFMTPDVLRRVIVRHPETGEIGAAEISEGTGIPTRGQQRAGIRIPIFGVSVIWVDAHGKTRRTDMDAPHGSRCFHSEPTDAPWPHRGAGYVDALEYVRGLGGRV
jgi:hypothetical protein